MNKHIETLIGFKMGTTKLAKEAFYELWDAWDDLVSAFKKIGKVLFIFIMFLVSLMLICCLPLATYLRLRWKKQNQIANEKALRKYQEQMSPVKRNSK